MFALFSMRPFPSHVDTKQSVQWSSSAPKSGGGGTNFFPEKWKAKKKKGHSGVKALDRVLWIGGGLYSNALFIKLLGYVQPVLKLYLEGGLGVLPQKIFTELGTRLAILDISRHVEWHIPVLQQQEG